MPHALVELARPLNVAMAAVGVAIGGLVAVGPAVASGSPWALGLAGVAAAAFTAGGNALNDIFDRATDAVNHPRRPIPSGRLSARRAGGFAGAMFAAALGLSVLVNVWCLAIAASNALLMYAYESDLKAKGMRGNVAIAYLVGSLFLFGGLAVYGGDQDALGRVGVLAALAFLATLGREITKDVEDVRGDVDRRTLPRRIGARRAGLAAAAAFVAGVVLSGVPWPLGWFGIPYVGIVALADGMFIYAALHSGASPARSQRVAKIGMVVALVAFLAGAVA